MTTTIATTIVPIITANHVRRYRTVPRQVPAAPSPASTRTQATANPNNAR